MRSVPDAQITATVDVSPWLEQKIAAVPAHHTEVEQGAAPGLIANLSASERERMLSTEWYIRHNLVSTVAAQTEFTA